MSRVLIGLFVLTITTQNISYADMFIRNEQQDQIKKRMIELEKFRPKVNMDGETRKNIAAREKYQEEIKKMETELVGKEVKNFICRASQGNIYSGWDSEFSTSMITNCYGNKDLRRLGKFGKDDENYGLTISKESTIKFAKKIYDGDVVKFSGKIYSIIPAPMESSTKSAPFHIYFDNVVIESIKPYK
jgi:hypothetical protein